MTSNLVKDTLCREMYWLLNIIWRVLICTFIMNSPRNVLSKVSFASTIWILRLFILWTWIVRINWLIWRTWVIWCYWNSTVYQVNFKAVLRSILIKDFFTISKVVRY